MFLAGHEGPVVSLPTVWTDQGPLDPFKHDEGAVQTLELQRVLLLPDGDDDLWREDYLELVELA